MRYNGPRSAGGVAISTSATSFPGIHFLPSGRFTGRRRTMTCSFTWRISGGWHSRVLSSDWRQMKTVGEGVLRWSTSCRFPAFANTSVLFENYLLILSMYNCIVINVQGCHSQKNVDFNGGSANISRDF